MANAKELTDNSPCDYNWLDRAQNQQCFISLKNTAFN